VIFFGEDVAKPGGVFKATVGLYEQFGPRRVRDCPISEQAILGAAMGAAIAHPDETIWAIVGDGGFQMTNQELATIGQEGIKNVKIAIVNNGYLGMVRQWQQFFHEKRYSCTPIWSPDYVKLAEAYGIPGYRVKEATELTDVVGRANAQRGPALVEFMIEQEANVYPMIPPGGSLSEPIEAEPAAATGD